MSVTSCLPIDRSLATYTTIHPSLLLNLPSHSNSGPSKAAVSALTRSMAAELMPKHVTVNAILPGYVETPMTRTGSTDLLAKMHPSGRMSGPVDMAGIALLYAGRSGAHITGTLMAIDGGMSLYKAERWGEDAKASFRHRKGPDGKAKL